MVAWTRVLATQIIRRAGFEIILEVQPIGFAERSGVDYKGKRRIRNNS